MDMFFDPNVDPLSIGLAHSQALLINTRPAKIQRLAVFGGVSALTLALDSAYPTALYKFATGHV